MNSAERSTGSIMQKYYLIPLAILAVALIGFGAFMIWPTGSTSASIVQNSFGTITGSQPSSPDAAYATQDNKGGTEIYLPIQAGAEQRAHQNSTSNELLDEIQQVVRAANAADCFETSADPADPPCTQGMPFTIVASGPPEVVTATSPNGDITETLPTYIWQDEGSATQYEVLIYDRDLSGTIDRTTYSAAAVCSSGTCSVSPSSPELVAGTRYLWRVKGINSAGFGPWNSPALFDVIENVSSPGTVTLNSPSGNTTDTLPTYAWQDEGSATQYEVLIYDRDLPGILDRTTYIASSICNSGTCSVNPSNPVLLVGTRYLWRVKGINSGGLGPWSTPTLFDVIENVSPPGTITPLNPSGDIADTSPTYEWQEEGGVTQYEVLIYDRDLPEILDRTTYAASSICSAGTCSVNPSSPVLVVDTRYLWRVKGINSGGLGPWSAPLFFDVVSVGAASLHGTLTEEQLQQEMKMVDFLMQQYEQELLLQEILELDAMLEKEDSHLANPELYLPIIQ